MQKFKILHKKWAKLAFQKEPMLCNVIFSSQYRYSIQVFNKLTKLY